MVDKQALLQEQMFFQTLLGKNALILQLLDQIDQLQPKEEAKSEE